MKTTKVRVLFIFLSILSCAIPQYTMSKRQYEEMSDQDLIEAMEDYELAEALDNHEAQTTQMGGSLLDFDLRVTSCKYYG